jgi:dUTP pyrophosphatase
MKLKIKVKRINKNIELPEIIEKGEWIDLRSSVNMTLGHPKAEILKRKKEGDIEYKSRQVYFCSALIPLGIAVKLPKGFEALVVARSSTPKFGVITANSVGIIDNSYSGNNDEWKYSCIAWADSKIKEGDRICQFRIQLSQKATVWQKLKWLLSSGIKIIEVDSLDRPSRGGFGTTGIK